MGRTFIFCFDGTCNAPDDAEQSIDSGGQPEDENISNVLKFHLLCGGSLAVQGAGWVPNQKCYYYAGIGTYGNFLQKAINAALAPEGSDVAQILKRAIVDFTRANFRPDEDKLLVVGFSRGGALARRFAGIIAKTIEKPCFYEAIFDTVASIGNPDIDKENRPKSEVLFENCTLPSNVVAALHLVSLDDQRKAFQPTLMNNEEKVTELWLAGAHSDVGGGFYQDGLSDHALKLMMEWLLTQDISVTIKSYQDIKYDNILPDDVDYTICPDDVMVKPDPLGTIHLQDRGWLFNAITLESRTCCVIRNDQPTDLPPKVHWSVGWRIHQSSDYRPRSLKGVKHLTSYPDQEQVVCHGLAPHIEMGQLNIKRLKMNESAIVYAYASEKYNRTGLLLAAGENYLFEVAEDQEWYDSDIACNAEGWTRDDVELGFVELPIAMFEPNRRISSANWFSLCGAIGLSENELFEIGKEVKYTPRTSGEFCPFANDLDKFYGNNRGRLAIKVTRKATSDRVHMAFE
ncbi:DUF2235 domain-containing protein [Corallincola platygyrae]|uniref:DUF2235 domain-containing protein n=1 Tax=Corallincola platygyrae TaxID=1193278 RepID=A0ABW4XK23_9GAMM